MVVHSPQDRQRIIVGKQNLEGVSGHNDQLEFLFGPVALRRGPDPLNFFRMRFASGYSQHCGRRINSCELVTAFRKGAAQRARTTTKVEDRNRVGAGK